MGLSCAHWTRNHAHVSALRHTTVVLPLSPLAQAIPIPRLCPVVEIDGEGRLSVTQQIAGVDRALLGVKKWRTSPVTDPKSSPHSTSSKEAYENQNSHHRCRSRRSAARAAAY